MKRSLSEAQKKRVASLSGWRCRACEHLLTSTYQIDHIIPLWEGGTNEEENLQPLCAECHAQKTQKEAMRRGKQPRATSSLLCLRCNEVVSAYFLHRCQTTPRPRPATNPLQMACPKVNPPDK